MTTHVHDHPIHAAGPRPDAQGPQASGLVRPARPRWLLPGLAIGLVAAALVVGGFMSLSTVLSLGFFGGMILMHTGGHGGHGGHASHGGRDAREGHDGATAPDAHDLSEDSHHSQGGQTGSAGTPTARAPIEANGSERQDHDQHRSHGCH
jgi:hypothetical protein